MGIVLAVVVPVAANEPPSVTSPTGLPSTLSERFVLCMCGRKRVEGSIRSTTRLLPSAVHPLEEVAEEIGRKEGATESDRHGTCEGKMRVSNRVCRSGARKAHWIEAPTARLYVPLGSASARLPSVALLPRPTHFILSTARSASDLLSKMMRALVVLF